MGQLGFFDADRRLAALSEKGDPLEAIAALVPWESFRADIEAVVLTPEEAKKSKAGRKPIDAIVMFRMLVLQSLYNLSDEQIEYQVWDRATFTRFVSLGSEDCIPDGTTLWLFREKLARAGLIEKLFDRFDQHLNAQGYIARGGQMVDASIVPVPHDAAINIMRRLLQATGVEVIHLGHNRSVEQIVTAAVQEDVNGIAVTSYQGGHIEFFKYTCSTSCARRGADEIKVFGGGGDVEEYFVHNNIRNFYSVSISGYHLAEAGANPISQLAFTLANGFTYVEAYLARGMHIDDFAPNLSFFFSNGMDPEYAVIGRVARRIWAIAMKHRYGANERSQKLKYHIQTSGRSLHAQEMAFNDIRTTLQALLAVYDNLGLVGLADRLAAAPRRPKRGRDPVERALRGCGGLVGVGLDAAGRHRYWAARGRVMTCPNNRARPRSPFRPRQALTSGRSLHAQEMAFNDIRTTLQALLAVYDNLGLVGLADRLAAAPRRPKRGRDPVERALRRCGGLVGVGLDAAGRHRYWAARGRVMTCPHNRARPRSPFRPAIGSRRGRPQAAP